MTAVRKAFEAMMKDADFLAEAYKLKVEVSPVPWQELERIVAQVLSTPAALAARARHILE